MVTPVPEAARALAPWPQYAQDEIDAAVRVLRSGKVNYWTGEESRLFEEEFAREVGCRYAVALANGSVALELAFHALQIPEGSEVVVTPRTFIASASAAVLQGSRPVFAEVDRDSQNITALTIEAVLTERTRAILCVHHAGWPCELGPIRELARARGIKVIEDCAQAHGASLGGQPVGSLSDAAAWSFCQDKIMTTAGEGGMLTTDDRQVWERAWAYKDHGKSYEAVYEREHAPGFRWLHESIGTNWRLTEPQAAIGRVQLGKLVSWSERRRANASVLLERLSQVPGLRVPSPPNHVEHAYYRFYCFIEPGLLKDGWTRDRIMVAVEELGIPCFSGSCGEIYLEKAFEGLRPERRLPVAQELGETSLALLVHPTLTPHDMHYIADGVTRVMQQAVRD
jgi:dTDP-4-amino-4,6-dideoxygalactose transaminase